MQLLIGRRGATLVEVLVTLSMIALIIAMLLPAVQFCAQLPARRRATRISASLPRRFTITSTCMVCYLADNNTTHCRPESTPRSFTVFPSLHAQLLPLLDQSNLYEAVNLRLSAGSNGLCCGP